MFILKEAEQEIQKALNEFDANFNAVVTFSDRPELCDFQCNVSFSLSKTLKKSPLEIAKNICEKIESENFEYNACAPGFINIKVKENYLEKVFEKLFESEDLLVQKEDKKKIFLDYGGPNVAKPLHVGHLRSAVIGETLKRLAKFVGNDVTSDVHLGDWGLQMGLTILGIINKFDVGYYFNKTGEKPNITMEDLNVLYPEMSAKSKEDENVKKQAQEITTKLQHKEAGYYDIWKDIRKISVDAIQSIYNKLNVSFDLFNGESDSDLYIPKVFEILNDKKLIEKSEGAEIVNVAVEGENKPMPPVIVKSSAGAGLYATTDIATILERVQKYNPDEIWYITDDRQSMHFEQVFRVCKLAGIASEKTNLLHLPFGTINGKDGKPFKTREGGVMRLSDLIDLVTNASNEKLVENGKEQNLNLAEKIGVCALKFGDMINFRGKDYVMDIDKFCSFDGKTGPYILYSLVRINSILNKAGNFKNCFKIGSDISREIIVNILKLSNDIYVSYKEKAPNVMCQSAYSLASSFSTLYANESILQEQNAEKKNALLTLLKLVSKSLQIVCDLLAVNVPEKM